MNIKIEFYFTFGHFLDPKECCSVSRLLLVVTMHFVILLYLAVLLKVLSSFFIHSFSSHLFFFHSLSFFYFFFGLIFTALGYETLCVSLTQKKKKEKILLITQRVHYGEILFHVYLSNENGFLRYYFLILYYDLLPFFTLIIFLSLTPFLIIL